MAYKLIWSPAARDDLNPIVIKLNLVCFRCVRCPDAYVLGQCNHRALGSHAKHSNNFLMLWITRVSRRDYEMKIGFSDATCAINHIDALLILVQRDFDI